MGFENNWSSRHQPTVVNNNTSSGGIGFVGLLTIVFIVLKLIGVIAWSWFWVLSPIWITFLAVLAIFVIIFAMMIVFGK